MEKTTTNPLLFLALLFLIIIHLQNGQINQADSLVLATQQNKTRKRTWLSPSQQLLEMHAAIRWNPFYCLAEPHSCHCVTIQLCGHHGSSGKSPITLKRCTELCLLRDFLQRRYKKERTPGRGGGGDKEEMVTILHGIASSSYALPACHAPLW